MSSSSRLLVDVDLEKRVLLLSSIGVSGLDAFPFVYSSATASPQKWLGLDLEVLG